MSRLPFIENMNENVAGIENPVMTITENGSYTTQNLDRVKVKVKVSDHESDVFLEGTSLVIPEQKQSAPDYVDSVKQGNAVIPIQAQTKPMVEVTWAELKDLRDSGKLIPGMQYRMTDYVTTVAQPECRSAGHPFDLILTADTVNQLNENVRACIHEGDTYFLRAHKASNVQILFTLTDDSEIAYVGAAPHLEDVILLGTYKDGVPCLYKTDMVSYPDEVDYEDYFLFVDEFEFDGVVYDRWEKYEGGGTSSGYHILTKVIVENNKFIEDVVVSNTRDYDIPSLWKIQYTIDNDKNRFSWADSVNGKGVIYHMIDEHFNDLPYDFKNIQFKRYKVTQDTSSLDSFDGRYFASIDEDDNFVMPEGYLVDSTDFIWCYTFSSEYDGENSPNDQSMSLDVYNNKVSNSGADLYNNVIFSNTTDGNTVSDGFKNNTIGNGISNNAIGNGFGGNTIGGHFSNNTVNSNFNYNTIGSGFDSNAISNNFHDNIIGNNFIGNAVDDSFILNTISEGFQSNTIGSSFNGNTIDGIFNNNTIGNHFSGNIVGDNFQSNIIGNSFQSNTIGINFQNNNIDNHFNHNTTIGDDFQYNTIGSHFNTNNIGNDFQRNTIGSLFEKNTIGNDFEKNAIGNYFGNNTAIGNNFQRNTIGNDFNSNAVGDSFVLNTIGEGFAVNTIGDNFESNNIGNNFWFNSSGDVFTSNTIGNSFQNNNIGNRFGSNTIGNSFHNNTIGNSFVCNNAQDGICFTEWSAVESLGNVQYVSVLSGVQGTQSNKKVLSMERDLFHHVTYKPAGSTEIDA